ncbi:hypothetical protein [Magnetospira sp. QH-2]|uniref:hypothetical protein n=1 Tax=Magnetospira sp. (strain QH-2) TaxID=1288970 RepID=UPI0003E81868|nr:hypothetical protein [Magnetospira sp. QH-2]CCQ72780.1 protein of unknown function [Magnetospira sp. QH-2]
MTKHLEITKNTALNAPAITWIAPTVSKTAPAPIAANDNDPLNCEPAAAALKAAA